MADGGAPATKDSAPPLPPVLSWSVFLGCSWTWCIGMFLPVILLRNLGLAGFVVFAIPNVLGAAAMGWVIRDPQRSRELVAEHQSACRWFSRATVWFQIFFLCWMFVGPIGRLAYLLISLGVLALLAMWGAGQTRKLAVAWVTLAISAAAAAALLWRHEIPRIIPHDPPLPSIDALWLAPLCFFGFGLCPFLDLTFHEARQALAPRGARAAFGIGFGIVFLAMILFTLAYSGWFGGGADLAGHPWVQWLLAVHLFTQCSFSALLHVLALGQSRRRPPFVDLPLLAGIIAAAAMGFWGADKHHPGAGETFYLGFMVFYGLVFPAYVWFYMMPFRRPGPNPWVLAMAILSAAPFYCFGFLEYRPIWLVPGVLLVMAARLAPAENRQS